MNDDDIDQSNAIVGAQQLENIRQSLGDADEWGETIEQRFKNARTVERDFFDLLGTYSRGVEATEQAVSNVEGLPENLEAKVESISGKRDRILFGRDEESEGYFDPETSTWNKGLVVQEVVEWGPEGSEKAMYGIERLDGELDEFLNEFSELEGVSYRPEQIREDAEKISADQIKYVAVEDTDDSGISKRALLGGAGAVIAGLWARGAYLEGRPDVWTEDGLQATEYSLIDREPDRIQDYVSEMQGEDSYESAFAEVQTEVDLEDAEMGFSPQNNRIDFDSNLDSTTDISVLMEDRFYEGARTIYDNID